MTGKGLTNAVDSIKNNTATAKLIQSTVTYSDLLSYLFTSETNDQKTESIIPNISRQRTNKFNYYTETRGIGSAPGIASGKIAYTAKRALEYQRKRESYIYLRVMRSSDAEIAVGASGIVEISGEGPTGHIAVSGRQRNVPVITNCSGIKFNDKKNTVTVNKHIILEGDDALVDGMAGIVYFSKQQEIPQTINREIMITNIDNNDDTVGIISGFVYKNIQERKVYSFGLDLAFLVMILKIKTAKSLFDVTNLSSDFDYLITKKQDSILWTVLLPQLSILCNQIGELLHIKNITDQKEVKNRLLRTLALNNDMATKSIDYRHHMNLLENALKHVDQLIFTHQSMDIEKADAISPNLLMVEDEPYLLVNIIQRLKDELNINLTIITNMQDAIEFIESDPKIDLAIIDLMIPNSKDRGLALNPYNGIKVSEKLKMLKGSNFPIMFLTTVRDIQVLEKITNSSVTRVINKPSLASTIVDAIKEMLANTNFADANLLRNEIQMRKLELESGDPNARIRAAWALSQYANHDSDIISVIKTVAKKDSSKKVRDAAKRILNQPFLLKDEKLAFAQKAPVAESRSVIIQGDVQDSIIILGDENSINVDR